MNRAAAGRGSGRSGHPEHIYGKQLPIIRSLSVGSSMDAAVVGNTLYVIGHRALRVADISVPAAPRVVSKLTGLGNVRQIEVHRNVAFITAREDGLFVVDVADRERPRLLCHYDTVELATGVALSGDLMCVACRHYGVELVDVSDPRKPQHLSTVRTGEAQSVVVRDGIVYVGVWGSRELVICDATDPRHPTVISRTPMDGYGDGLCVRGRYCYAATGHHARACRRRERGEPGYGAGHGLEIFDIADPAKPVFVSRIKMPAFYRLGMDMWDVMVAGRYAFVADTYNGLFVVDVADPTSPRFVAHRQLPYVKSRRDPSPAAGIALATDHVYVAGAWSDLHVVGALGLAQPPEPEPDRSPAIPTPRPPARNHRYRLYKPDGQVYAVAFAGDVAFVAAGAAGIHAVELWPRITKLAERPTEGFAMDVKVLGDRVFVAEGRGGLSIWRHTGDGQLRPIGRYRAGGQPIKQVVVPPPGKYALLHVGANTMHIVDVAAPTHPTRVLSHKHLGLLYGYQIADGLLEGRYASCMWHVTGYYWFDLYGGPTPIYTGDNYHHRFNASDGMAMRQSDALVTRNGKYSILKRGETRPPDELPAYGIPGHRLRGKPTLDGTTLFVACRDRGTVSAVDITKIDTPRLLDHIALDGNPNIVVVRHGDAIIPAGYQGLLVWHVRR